MDASNSFFPMDLGGMAMQTDGLPNTSPVVNGQASNVNGFGSNGGPFMGSVGVSAPMDDQGTRTYK